MAIIKPAIAVLFLAAVLGGEDAHAFTTVPNNNVARTKHSISSVTLRASTTNSGDIASSSSSAAPVKEVAYDPSSFYTSDIDAGNTPPNLRTILSSLSDLKSGSDLRGTYLSHKSSGGTIANVSHLVKQFQEDGANGGTVALTPFAAHCFGAAFARWLLQNQMVHHEKNNAAGLRPGGSRSAAVTICIGRDPRVHGERLADSFARGAESVEGVTAPVRAAYTGVATTPAMYEFVRADKCDASVMITASHLPDDKNGMKFFSKNGGLGKSDIDELVALAQEEARDWYDLGVLPPSSGNAGVLCSELVDFMPYYEDKLKKDIVREVGTATAPLSGLSVIVNPGNGAGCFFDGVLRDLGANVAGSIHLAPDGTWPDTFGVPNPEKKEMVEETMRVCEECNADIGVMFDTDADRAGFVLPRNIDKDGVRSGYEPLNRNRLIALLSVIFSESAPGCTVVTDSTTSEGLETFLESKLGLNHFRFLRGYANVIGKAKELTESGAANAEVAIETSGHCALKENGYQDDGTYTAVKILGLLARTKAEGDMKGSLLDLIEDLVELPFDEEFRLQATDGLLETTTSIFKELVGDLKEMCDGADDWSFDEDNLEGVRFRLSSGGFFMLRQSLHDPVISMQVESISQEEASDKVLKPLLDLMSKHDSLDYSALEKK